MKSITYDNDWIFWSDAKSHRLNGFRVASEKVDTQYFISIQNWIYIFSTCVKNFINPHKQNKNKENPLINSAGSILCFIVYLVALLLTRILIYVFR